MVPQNVARRARELRTPHRTRSGRRLRSWVDIADALAMEGLGRWKPADLSQAADTLPAEEHPLARLRDADAAELEWGWREGWAEYFPREPWPGLAEAQRRIRLLELRGRRP